ncbi:hypothetical protein RB213_002110 [Colletotrichum asianum]
MLTRGKAKQKAPAANHQDTTDLLDRLCQFETADADLLEAWKTVKESYSAAPPDSAFEPVTTIDADTIETSPQPLDTRPAPLPFFLWISHQLASSVLSRACRLEHSAAIAKAGTKDKLAQRLTSLAGRLHCDPAVFYECFGPKIALSRDVLTNLQELINSRPEIRLLDLAAAYYKERAKAQPKTEKGPVRKPATIVRRVIEELTPELQNVTFRHNRRTQRQREGTKRKSVPRQNLPSKIPQTEEPQRLQHSFSRPDSENGDQTDGRFSTKLSTAQGPAVECDPCQNDDPFDDSIENSRGGPQACADESAIEQRFLAYNLEREGGDENQYNYDDFADTSYVSNAHHAFTADSLHLDLESSVNIHDSVVSQQPSRSPRRQAADPDLSTDMSFGNPTQHSLKRPFSHVQESSPNSLGSPPLFSSFRQNFASSSKGCSKPTSNSPKRQKSGDQLSEGQSAHDRRFVPSMDWRCLSEKHHITDAIINHFLVALCSADVGVVNAFLSNAKLEDVAKHRMELQTKEIVLIPHQANGFWRLFVTKRGQSLLQELDPTNDLSDIGKQEVLPRLQQLFQANSLTDVTKVGHDKHDSGINVIAFAFAMAKNGTIDALGPTEGSIDGVAWRHHLQHRLLRGRALPVWLQSLSPSLSPPPIDPTSYGTLIRDNTLALMRRVWSRESTLRAMDNDSPYSIEALCAKSERLLNEVKIGLAMVNALHAMHITVAQSARRAWKGLEYDAIAFNVLEQLNSLCSLYGRADEILQHSAQPAVAMPITRAQITSLRIAAMTASEAAKE